MCQLHLICHGIEVYIIPSTIKITWDACGIFLFADARPQPDFNQILSKSKHWGAVTVKNKFHFKEK